MANTFTDDLLPSHRQAGQVGKSHIQKVGTLVIDTPASAFPASLFNLKEIVSVQPIVNDDDSNFFDAVVDFDSLGITTKNKDTGATLNLSADSYRVSIVGT